MRDVLTNDHRPGDAGADVEALALRALAWTLSDPDRASRFLSMTGLDPADLRSRAGDPATLSACLGFLEAHEPDLVACADALDIRPSALVAAHARLEA